MTYPSEYHQNLRPGTMLESKVFRLRIRVMEPMRGPDGHFEYTRKDGERDQRFSGGWTGRIDRARWKVLTGRRS